MNTTSLVAESAEFPAAAAPAAPAPVMAEASAAEVSATEASAGEAPVAELNAAEAPVAELTTAEAPAAELTAAEAAPADVSAEEAPAAAAPLAAPASATASPRSLLKQFQQQFPAFRDCLPLAIGIDKQILARMPNLDRKSMRTALGIHTGSLRYLRAMEKATQRFDLDGVAGAEVTETHRSHAKETLQQRFKKEAERKKAERDAAKAERDAAQAAEADRLRQEKLQLLASKFSRNG